ncbi:MAG: hypothetical protein BJ554DRAFT_5511, partial [Olpidium bornovanus]
DRALAIELINLGKNQLEKVAIKQPLHGVLTTVGSLPAFLASKLILCFLQSGTQFLYFIQAGGRLYLMGGNHGEGIPKAQSLRENGTLSGLEAPFCSPLSNGMAMTAVLRIAEAREAESGGARRRGLKGGRSVEVRSKATIPKSEAKKRADGAGQSVNGAEGEATVPGAKRPADGAGGSVDGAGGSVDGADGEAKRWKVKRCRRVCLRRWRSDENAETGRSAEVEAKGPMVPRSMVPGRSVDGAGQSVDGANGEASKAVATVPNGAEAKPTVPGEASTMRKAKGRWRRALRIADAAAGPETMASRVATAEAKRQRQQQSVEGADGAGSETSAVVLRGSRRWQSCGRGLRGFGRGLRGFRRGLREAGAAGGSFGWDLREALAGAAKRGLRAGAGDGEASDGNGQVRLGIVSCWFRRVLECVQNASYSERKAT